MNIEERRDHDTSRGASGPSGDTMHSLKSEGASSSSTRCDAREGTSSTPLGLGLGGLERKVRFKCPCSTGWQYLYRCYLVLSWGQLYGFVILAPYLFSNAETETSQAAKATAKRR